MELESLSLATDRTAKFSFVTILRTFWRFLTFSESYDRLVLSLDEYLVYVESHLIVCHVFCIKTVLLKRSIQRFFIHPCLVHALGFCQLE